MASGNERLTKKRAEEIKKRITKELEKEEKMLLDFLDNLKMHDGTIYIGNPSANNEEELSRIQAQIARKNVEVDNLKKRMHMIDATLMFIKKHPYAKLPNDPEIYNGVCKKCNSTISQKQRIARCAPLICVSCAK